MSDDRLSAFFDKQPWRAELAALRQIALDAGLDETFKWNGPCYMAAGGNVAALWRLKDCAALAFFKGALMDDPAGVFQAPGENSRAMRTLKYRGLAEITAAEGTIRAYLADAIALQKSGRKVEFRPDDLELPQELTARLGADAAFREAWEGLTPGRRRGYALF
ncbi:MAG: DUF1801 domain-containing protein, partial [Paracoccus sp. (in: a-proteobacteria)]|nr:DUF1801 domain-containing protein [Paracoccus sp. (in: a-proteobacteria)]